MEVYIIGYPWCKHFRNALEKLNSEVFSVRVVKIESETPNRMLLRNVIKKIIGKHKCVGAYASTSPQIVVLFNNTVVCVPGEEELLNIGPGNLDAFVRRVCSGAGAIVPRPAE